VHNLVSCIKGRAKLLYTVAKLLRVLVHVAVVAGCLLETTGLVEQEGKGKVKFYNCL
jgi:hypothetical protein